MKIKIIKALYSIMDTEVYCVSCGWNGKLRDCEPNDDPVLDTDGQPCCPRCQNEVDEQ
jgi:hypothetical protein